MHTPLEMLLAMIMHSIELVNKTTPGTALQITVLFSL